MNYYDQVLYALECYFADRRWKKLFLRGGCYWLANMLHQGIKGSIIMINRVEEHRALYLIKVCMMSEGVFQPKIFTGPAKERSAL